MHPRVLRLAPLLVVPAAGTHADLPHVLAFTGLPASGKSAAVEVARERGIPVVRMGELVLEEVGRRGLPLDEEHVGPVASGMRAEHGDDIWAKRTMERLRTAEKKTGRPAIVIVDGVRSLAEIEHFRSALGDRFTLVAIEAPTRLRHERLRARGRSDDPAEAQVIAARDARERGWGIEDAIRNADHRIRNDAGLARLREEVGALLHRLGA